ncbi:MAG: DUF4038 domain-containing protein [Planctomycetes bacterium]|nr:DUF4038 domain-containing protein [Planctomycetota bacterium]
MLVAGSMAIVGSLLCLICLGALLSVQAAGPLSVHPDNPRYFSDGSGKAVYLTGSHTWAVLQERGIEGQTPDFDYPGYLDFLQKHGHNFIRLWVWEHAQWMQFAKADVPVRYQPLPFLRTGPGTALDGKPKFDLTKFNDEFFHRLRKRVEMAHERGLYVGVMFFQGFSVQKKGIAGGGNQWHGNPYNKANNINGIDGDPSGGDTGRETHTLTVPDITRIQENYVRRVIDTLNDLDNVLWEIGNELHESSIEWQYHMIRFIRDYEKNKPKRHVIGMTGAPIKNAALFASPADWISPINKTYLDDPPVADGRKIVIVDTDHIRAFHHDPQWVWKSFLRGCHFILMDGYRDYRIGSPPKPDPGWDVTRRAMGQALAWSRRVNLAAMTPRPALASTGYCLAQPGIEYLVYLPDGGDVSVDLTNAVGALTAEWYDPTTGMSEGAFPVEAGAERMLSAPFWGPALLYIRRDEPR